jgi:hypothetical protein
MHMLETQKRIALRTTVGLPHFGSSMNGRRWMGASRSKMISRQCLGLMVAMGLLLLQACGSAATEAEATASGPKGLDQTDPAQVVAAIFEVASGRAAPEVLAQLCDPAAQNDNDTRRICDNAAGFDPEGEFGMFFKAGKLSGPAQVEGDFALVPFLFGPKGDEAENMELVRRNGKWYLSQF